MPSLRIAGKRTRLQTVITFVFEESYPRSHHVHSGLVIFILEFIESGVNAHAPQLGFPNRGRQLHGHY